MNITTSISPFSSSSILFHGNAIVPLEVHTLLPMALIFFMFLVKYFKMIKENYEPNSSSRPPLPPGPKPWPLVGNLPEMLTSKPTFRWIHKIMEETKSEICCIRLGNVHVISVTSPEIACQFLKKQDAVFATRPICMSADMTSNGYLSAVLSPWGEQWKKMRRVLTSEVLSPTRHRWLHAKRSEEADHLIRVIYNKCMAASSAGGLTVNLRDISRHYCGNVIRKMIFNKRFFGEERKDGGPGKEDEEHVAALFTILKYLYSFCITDYVPFLRGVADLDGHEKILKEALAIARKYHDLEIDERLKRRMDGSKNNEEAEDVLDVFIMLKEADGNKPLLSSEEIKALVMEMMLATVDNPSNCIEWALAEMMNQPEKLQKAVEELDRVVGKEKLVQESDLPHLNYVKACAREAFRLHPVAPFNLPHVSLSDTTVSGYFIPKGSHVLLSRSGLGRNPRVWHDPLRFDPERHLKDGGAEVVLAEPNLRMISFSTGRRGCAAVTLGTTMTTMLLARLLQGFSWRMPCKASHIDLSESVDELTLSEPLLLLAEPRLAENLYPK